MSSFKDIYDAIVVGGGFGGVYQLYQLRSLGFRVKGFEKGSKLGGVWYWNKYPGVRVDSDAPIYQLWIEECYKDWEFTERFPNGQELCDYFQHVDKKLHLSQSYTFNTCVEKATFDMSTGLWTITTSGEGQGTYLAKNFVVCSGFAAKKYIPDIPGIANFKGRTTHTAQWPEDLDLNGKKVAVIGTGASGVQVVQAVSAIAGSLTVFQRTPNIAIPMQQKKLDRQQEILKKPYLPQLWEDTLRYSAAGTQYRFDDRSALEVTPEEREEVFQKLFDSGGFNFWVGTFYDVWTNPIADSLQYDFWRRQVHKRVKDPVVAEKLAPKKQMCTFCSKRPSLEQNYYEAFNQDNVRLVDVKTDPIIEFTEHGIRTQTQDFEFDAVIFATGFDTVAGGLIQIDITGINGLNLTDKWNLGVNTYLGVCTSWFPNLYFMFGPQGPTAFANGPTCVQIQADWITDAIIYTQRNNLRYMYAAPDAEVAWREHVNELQDLTLLKGSKSSWYVGTNIPGKKAEALIYLGGVPKYLEELGVEADSSYKNFIKVAK